MSSELNIAAMRNLIKAQPKCRVCGSTLLLAINRWGAWWIHCNHCGVDIPALLLLRFLKPK